MPVRIQREICCRACGQSWEGFYSHTELPVSCECGSSDTFSALSPGGGFILRDRGGVGWAGKGSGFHPRGERHIDIGPATAGERARARELVKRHKAGDW